MRILIAVFTKAEFEVTRVNYIHNAKQMLSQFQPYMGYGDRNQQYVIRKLGRPGGIWKNGLFLAG